MTKEYIFKNELNHNIQIVIKARSLNEALDLLNLVVKYAEDFSIIF